MKNQSGASKSVAYVLSLAKTRQLAAMKIHRFTFNPFQTNCYICHDGEEAVLVDPSCHTRAEQQAVVDYLVRNGLRLRHLLLTHGHIDHIFGCRFFSDYAEQGFWMHQADVPFLEQAEAQRQFFNVPVEPPPLPEGFLHEGDTLTFGQTTWTVLHTPGHSPGSISFYDAQHKLVIVGDVLFQGSIGRTDLPGGSLPVLMQSIFQKLLPLGDETRVYPGHGPQTTIGQERQHNPFLTGAFPL